MMSRQMVFLAIALLAGMQTAPARAEGDPKRGLAYASRHCTECHTIERDGWTSPEPAAPSFSAVAQTPGITWIALTAWLQTSHKDMPNLIIPPEDREDVIAYILSLQH